MASFLHSNKLSPLYVLSVVFPALIGSYKNIIMIHQSKSSLILHQNFPNSYGMHYTWQFSYFCLWSLHSNILRIPHSSPVVFKRIATHGCSEVFPPTSFYSYKTKMAASSSNVDKLSHNFSKHLSVSEKTTRHVSLKDDKKKFQSFCLIGLVCREDLAVSRGLLRYQLRSWGNGHDFTIINTGRRNVLIFRMHNRSVFLRIVRGRPHSAGGYLLALMPWDFGMNISNVHFQFEIFTVEFRVRSDLDRDNIPYMVASEAGEVISLFARDNTGVVKAIVKLRICRPLCRKVKMTLEDGEKVKFALYYLGFPSATCRDCFVLNHSNHYCGLVANLAWRNVPVLTLQGADPLHDHAETVQNQMHDVEEVDNENFGDRVDAVAVQVTGGNEGTNSTAHGDMEVDGEVLVRNGPILSISTLPREDGVGVEFEKDPPNTPVAQDGFVSDLGESSSGSRKKRPRLEMEEGGNLDALAHQINLALHKFAEAVYNDQNGGLNEMVVVPADQIVEPEVAAMDVEALADITNQVQEDSVDVGLGGQQAH